jgi:hypothetical protein
MLGDFCLSIWNSNPVVVLGAFASFVFCRDARIPVATAVLMFLPSHGTEMLAQWEGAYGYSNAPSALLLIVAFAGFVGMVLAGRLIPPHLIVFQWARVAVLVLFAAGLAIYLTNLKDHLDNYYFSWKRLNHPPTFYVYHDGILSLTY